MRQCKNACKRHQTEHSLSDGDQVGSHSSPVVYVEVFWLRPDTRTSSSLMSLWGATPSPLRSSQRRTLIPLHPTGGSLPSTVLDQEDRDKAIFLEELEAIRDACQGPWAVTGDFNLILNEEDKSNDRIDRANLRRFRRTVAALELQDLHLHGRAFTWSNERENPTLVRLDRVLVSMDWEELFPNAPARFRFERIGPLPIVAAD